MKSLHLPNEEYNSNPSHQISNLKKGSARNLIVKNKGSLDKQFESEDQTNTMSRDKSKLECKKEKDIQKKLRKE
jgi:hypothetical protein